MADDRDKSARYVLGGKRHDGSKGKKYTKWRENFLDAAEGEGDADWSMAQQFLGQDGPQGGLGGRHPLPMQRTLIGAWVMMIVFPDEQRRGFASMQHATCYASCAPVNTAAGVCRM